MGMTDKKPIRTIPQNAALHVYFELLAKELNDAGLDMKKVFEVKAVEVPWSAGSVKEVLWRPIQGAMIGEESTTKLTTIEISEVYEVLNRHTAQKLGVSVPWPSYYNERD